MVAGRITLKVSNKQMLQIFREQPTQLPPDVMNERKEEDECGKRGRYKGEMSESDEDYDSVQFLHSVLLLVLTDYTHWHF